MILLRHGVDSDDPRRWPCAAACARSSRPATSPASPPPCTGRAAWPTRSPRPWRTRPRPRRRRRAMAAGRGRAGRAHRPPPTPRRARSSPSSPPRAASARAWSRPTSACALATPAHRVCLVDLDVNSGDVAIMLQLDPDAHDQRPGRLQRRRSTPECIVDDPDDRHSDRLSARGGTGPARLARPRHRRRTSASMIDTLKAHVRLRRGRHLRGLRRPRAHAPSTAPTPSSWSAPSTSRRSRPSSSPPARSTCSTSAGTTWKFVLNRADGKVGLTVGRVRVDPGAQGRRHPRLQPRGPGRGQPRRGARQAPTPATPTARRSSRSRRAWPPCIAEPAGADEGIPSQPEVQRLPAPPEEGLT